MPDLRNGSLEGEQYLEELQVPPSPCASLKSSSLLRPLAALGTVLGHSERFSAESCLGFLDMVSAGYVGKKPCPLLSLLLSFSATR